MAYTPFDITLPKPKDTIGTTLSNIKNNIQVVRDILASMGMVQGFNYSWSGGTADFPTNILLTKGAEIVKIINVYIAFDGQSLIISRSFYYSSDTGSNYFPIADELGNFKLNYSYDVSGILTTSTWTSV